MNGEIEFRMRIKLDIQAKTLNDRIAQCAEIQKNVKYNNKAMLNVYGLGKEVSTVEIDVICDCNCTDQGFIESIDNFYLPHALQKIHNKTMFDCSDQGEFECGVCKCDDGYSGSMCQCFSDTEVGIRY